MLRRYRFRPAILVLLSLGVAANSPTADVFYLGTWKIASADVAPWWNDAQKPDASEVRELVGKSVTFAPKAIAGPRQTACKDPRFRLKEYQADMLFQGSFGEMHERNKAVDPARVAATVGFRGSRWKTLETGCANELDFHFIDSTTAAFALNNYIYKMKKQQ